ncbi:MAG: tetratricopeptide repeat protein [Candidatus Methanoperedens sp.]
MEYDVFFSYPHKDAAEVQQILEALQSEGLNVWIDKSEISDFDGITRSIIDGLAHSKVLLAYYSRNYWGSRACQWELTAGFLAAQREDDPRKRVLVINPEEKAEHIHPVELRDELFQKAPKDADALKKLVLSVKDHISRIKSVIGEIHPLTQPRWYGRKLAGSNRFVGRLPDMWKIHSGLNSCEVPIITGSKGCVEQVHGMGGVGKSLLAEEYALRYAAAYPGGIFWLRATGSDDGNAEIREAERIRQIIDIAVESGIPVKDRSPKEIEADLSNKLASFGKPFLWIVDDLPSGLDMDTFERWFAPQPGKTLITTRTREYSSKCHFYPLGVLEPQEAYDLVTLQRKPSGKDEENAAHSIVKDLGYHALAVDVAGAAMPEYESFGNFMKKLQNPNADELEFAKELTGTLPTGHEKSIAVTFLKSIDRTSPECRDFLRLASMISATPIPLSLVSVVFSEADGLDEETAERKAMIAMNQAKTFSLAESVDDEAPAKTVHTLISRTVRFRETRPERRDQIQAAVVSALIAKLSVINDYRIHSELKLEITHARQLVNKGDDIQIANLMGWVARYDHLQGAYKSAQTLLHRECDIRNRLQGEEHPDTLTTMNNLAETLHSQGDLVGTRKIHEQVLEIRRRTLDGEHPDTLTTMNNLAETLGSLAGARKIYEQVLEITRRTLGGEHHNTLTTMNNLAETLCSQGDLIGARKIHEQVLEIRRRTLGEEHPDTLTTMNNLAETLHSQGDLAGARKIQEHVLEIRRRTLGEEHRDTLQSMNNLAATLRSQGDLADAQIIQEQVLEITRRTLGEKHPNTSGSAWNLVVTLLELGDNAKAIDILKKHLLWLIDRDPVTLEVKQQQIREMIIQMRRGSARAGGAALK